MNLYLKNLIIALSVLFLSWIVIVQVASAHSSVQFGSTHGLDSTEINLDAALVHQISFYSAVGGYGNYDYYGAQTMQNNIFWAAGGAGSSVSQTFYIGHGDWDYCWNPFPFYEQQFYVYMNDGSVVHDKDIFPYSSCQNVKFAFMYACKQGDTLGGTHWSGTPFGMPYCWLHDETVSTNGYASPSSGSQVFIGFNGSAVMFGNTQRGGDNYRQFVSAFYYASLVSANPAYSVNQALDYAARAMGLGYANFGESDLYKGIWWLEYNQYTGLGEWIYMGNMRVFGNGNIHLSNAMPTVAMKTRTNGNFYVPASPPTYSAVQVLEVFGDSMLAGDQTGGTPPYTSISRWPNGVVDIYDALFVQGHFNQQEGNAN